MRAARMHEYRRPLILEDIVSGGWGDGTCRHCHMGNTQICAHGQWPGFGPYGRYAEFLPVSARYPIKVDERLPAEELAPLTDAGLTAYRGMKKLRAAGALGLDRVLAVRGIGGLGAYAVQYAELLGAGAAVVACARHPDKLAIARNTVRTTSSARNARRPTTFAKS